MCSLGMCSDILEQGHQIVNRLQVGTYKTICHITGADLLSGSELGWSRSNSCVGGIKSMNERV
jgi:hypothetical protein